MDLEAMAAIPVAALGAMIGPRHAGIVADQAELMAMIGSFDAREGWRADGAVSMATWLVAALKVTYATAAGWVALAGALPGLPKLAASLGDGEVCLESAAAAAQLATLGSGRGVTDEGVTTEAKALPADLLNKAVRRQEQAAAQAAPQSAAARPRAALRWWHSEDGWWQFRGWLPPEAGEALARAIDRAEDDGPDPATGEYDPGEVRAAEGLAALASASLAADADPDRACVVVHVGVGELVTGQGTGELASGVAVPAEVVRRLACDARIEAVLARPSGVVGIGRASRQVPAPLLRYLKDRDGSCRFPGCGRTRHLHAHHIQHWANGGETEPRNLLLLCHRHHALVHEGGWSLTGNPEPGPGVADTLSFHRHDGTAFQPTAAPPPPDIAGMDLMTYLRTRHDRE